MAAITLTAGLIAGAAIGRNLVSESESEVLRQAEATANLILSAVRQNLPVDDERDGASILRTLEIAKTIGGHDYVEARVIGIDRSRFSNVALPATPLLDALGSSPELDTIVEIEVAGEPVLAYVRGVAITQRGDARMLIAIGRSEPLLASNLLIRPLLLSLGIGALLATVLASWVAGHVGRRLDELGKASQSIAAGDFSVRAPEQGNDDVARLGASFNEMVLQLEDSRRRERDFLMSVGHDLRTPLTTLRGYAEALDAGEIEQGDLERVGGVLRRQTDRLSRLVEDLTLLARLEAREFTLRPELVALGPHVEGLVEAHQARAAEMGVTLELDVADVGLLEIDPDRVGQIVGNLVDNALRYTPEGGKVSARLLSSTDQVVLSVADTGPGIDREDLDHVFERLYVAQRYRPVRPEGSGLGLSIVKELVDAMGGSITVTSILGHGTTVGVAFARTTPRHDGPQTLSG